MRHLLLYSGIIGVLLLYVAWLNGMFSKCPHCRKIGSWRFNNAEPAVDVMDKDGHLQSRSQIRICRKCKQRILDKWSDQRGRTFEKLPTTTDSP